MSVNSALLATCLAASRIVLELLVTDLLERAKKNKKREKIPILKMEIIAGDSSSVEAILRSLGLENEADMLADNGDINAVRRALAPHVGIEPRDTRLDRLLRLCLRLMPKGDESDEQRYALLALLAELANELSKWTRIRLEARHSGAQGNLIHDSKTLGEALNRIPGLEHHFHWEQTITICQHRMTSKVCPMKSRYSNEESHFLAPVE